MYSSTLPAAVSSLAHQRMRKIESVMEICGDIHVTICSPYLDKLYYHLL
jgi:hypothetical protein